MKTIFLFFIECLLITFFSTVSFYPQQRLQTEANNNIVEYTNKEGLPINNFKNIVQTKDGYIWISGVEGTYRFDGYDFESVGEKYGVPEMQDFYYDSTNNILYFASPDKFITFNGKTFKTYSEKDGYKINGLTGQVISFIKSDSKGRIWIGSETPYVDKKFNGGLTEFNHGKFTVYDSSNFPLDNAKNFIETPYGDLIFISSGHNTQTSEGSYLALYKNGVFKKIDESVGINLQNALIFPSNISSVIDAKGNTWLACMGILTSNQQNSEGVLMYDGTNFHQYTGFVKDLEQNQFPIEVFYSQKMNKLFLTTAYAYGKVFSPNNKTIFEFDGSKWIPSHISEKINSIKKLNSTQSINDFHVYAALFSRKNKYFPESLMLSNTIQSTQSAKYPTQYFSFENNKWVKYDAFFGTAFLGDIKNGYLVATSKGFGIYYPNYSKMLTTKDGLLQQQMNIPTAFTDKNGNVWISYSYSSIPAYAQTYNIGLNVWDGDKLRTFTEKDGLAGNVTFDVFEDSRDNVWIPTSKGLTIARTIKNSEGKQIFKFQNIPSSNNKPYNTTNVFETSKGNVYAWQNYVRPASSDLISADFCLGKFDGEKFVKINSPFSEKENEMKYQTLDLREDNLGRLWLIGEFSNNIKDITTVGSKIKIYNGKVWQNPPKSWNVPNEQLHFVGKLKNGMYFLTVDGFYVFNGDKFINLIDSVNQYADFRILKGASVAGTKTNIQAGNYLYIRLRNRGLAIYDGKVLNFYTKKTGMPSTSISNPISDNNGNVFFSFPSGAFQVTGNQFQTFYDDENIVSGGPAIDIKDGYGNLLELYNGEGLYVRKINEQSYPMKISSVVIDDKPNYYSLPSKLSYSQNSFLFNFSALDFKDPDQTTYEHFLEGYDKAWSRPSDLSFSEYQNLPSGKYIFKVRGITSNGVKTETASYSFIIYPPFWKTWWAYTIYVLFFGLGLVVFRKYEKGKILKKEAEKLKDERSAAALKEAELRAQIAETESARKSKELEEARSLQLSMLPKQIPSLPHLDIAVYMKTATEVGGDYYDFHLHPDGTLTVILGDATGHGMRSGMMVSIMKSLFMSDRSNKELKRFFENASAAIKDMQLGRLMMALNCIQINNNRVVTTNAGMPPLILYKSKLQTVEEIALNNMPLGAMNGLKYDTAEFNVDKGDTLLMMSDGFAELRNNNGELYGYRRARNCFEESARKEPEEIVNHLKEAGMDWTNNADPADDVTFVVIKVK